MLLSFGSFGDIATAVDLALRIVKALRSSSGSSYEYQYLLQELHALAYVLQLANATTHTGMLPLDVTHAIVAEIARCRVVMDRLWERIHGYQKALGTPGGIGSSWRKIGWALFKTQDIEETRAKLATHRMSLVTLITVCNIENIEELKAQITRLQRSLHLRLDEICSVVRQLPRTLGYTHANAVTLKDWRGIDTVMPMEFCHDVGQMNMALKAVSLQWSYFARHQVQEEMYYLLWEETGMVWDPSASKSLVSKSGLVPGATVRLFSLICFRFSVSGGSEDHRLLSEENSGSASDGVKRGCYVCGYCLAGGRHREMVPDKFFIAYAGCRSEDAEWRVLVEEVYDSEKLVEQQFTLHDPSFAGCAASHLGVPLIQVPWTRSNCDISSGGKGVVRHPDFDTLDFCFDP